MNTTEALFVRWMAAMGHTSQRAAARALKVSPMGPVNWKNGNNAQVHVIERMANDLGEDPIPHIIRVFQETAKGPDIKTIQRLAKKIGAAAVVGVALALPAPPASATGPQAALDNAAHSIHYAQSRRRGRKPRRLRTRAQMPQRHAA